VNGSIGVVDRSGPSATRAVSSEVNAFMIPIDMPPMRPVTLVAPKIVVLLGDATKPSSGSSASICGRRPIRRV
jgi:hypothetical protein